MKGDGWIAALTALVVFVALSVVLAVTATRWPASADAGYADPAEDGVAPAAPLLCVSSELICVAPPMPVGYPCTCQHPLRGTLPGWVASSESLGLEVIRERTREPATFDGDELAFP
jgi:hypothetical protein